MSGYNTQLGNALGFSERELESNRSGVLTREQEARLRRDNRQMTLSFAVGSVGFIGGALAALVLLAPSSTKGPLVFVLALLGVFCAYMTWIGWDMEQEVSLSAEAVEGAVRCKKSRNRHGDIHHRLVIDDRTFPVDRDIWRAFEDGQVYRLYLVDGALLSAERAEG